MANNQANKLRLVASQEAENARQSEDRAKKNADKAKQIALEANRLSEAAQLAERAMERTAQQAEADRIVAQRESYRFTVKLAESMLQGNEEAKFRVADILWQTQPELRAWEWGYLMAQCPLEEWSLQTDATGLSSAVGTVDGRFLITAGIGGTVALWDLESRQQVWQQVTGFVHHLAVDRQGRFVGVSTGAPQFKILDLATGNVVHQSDRTGQVECAFSARGEDLYVLEQGTLRCISTSTWEQRAQATLTRLNFDGHPWYYSLIVDEAGKYVGVDLNKHAGSGQPRFSCFVDAQTLGSTTQLAGYNEVGNNVANPSTPILNSAQGELTFSITSKVYRKTINGERSLLCDLSDYVLYLTVDPVSGNVLSATANGEVQIVDGDGGKHSILHGAPITGLATLPQGRFVTAGADGLVKCWTLSPSGALAAKTAAPVFASASANFVDFTSDGKSLLYRTWDRHNSLYQLDSLSYHHFVYPDRGGYNNVFPMIGRQTNELLDYSNDRLLFFPQNSRGTDAESTRSIPVARPFSAAFDDKGRILVVASADGNPAVFDLESNKPVPAPNVKGNGPVAINPSGSRAAVQTRERLLIWEVATGRLLNSLEAEHNGDAAIPPDFHPEGELIAVLAHHKNPGLDRLVVWNSSLGETQTTIESQPGVSFKSCKFSADGHRLYALCSNDKVRILDWKLGKELIALTGGANLGSIAVSPDGLTLAYAGFNPNLFFVKSLPWEGETPRSSNFYRAVDDLRLYTVRTTQTINESIDLIEITNHSDKPIRIDYEPVAILGLFKSEKRTLRAIAPKETIEFGKVSPGTQFRFIDPDSSEQLASFTKSDIAITTVEGPVGIKVVLPGRDPMTQAAAEELQGDIAQRQGRPADAIAHYTSAVSIRTSIVRDNPSKASSQGSLAIAFLKNLAVTPVDKADDRTALLQQAISFWQELTQNPDSKPATWQHLLRFQLQLVDHLVAIGAAESQPQVVSPLSIWNKQSKNHPENRLFAYGLSELIRKLPAVYPDGIDQPTLDSLISEHPELAGVIGDAYAAERNWEQAVALYSHGIQHNAPSLGLFAKRAMAYEQKKNWEAASADWLRAVPVNPDASRRLVSLVQRLTDGEEFALAESVRVRARLVFEEQLVTEPENSSLAGELADLLLPMGARTLLPTSEAEGVAWQFTTTQPPDNWTSQDFDDSAWQEGLGGFGAGNVVGAGNTEGFARRSTWTTNDIWLRRTFEWQPASTEHSLVLRLIQDDAVEVYINGRQVAKLPLWTSGYIDHLLDAAAVEVLHAGTNTTAVHCRQYSGGQHVDAGLVAMPYGPLMLQQRFAAMKITDPWARLVAAYVLTSDIDRAADLLSNSRKKLGIAAWLDHSQLSDEVLDSLQSRHPDIYSTLLLYAASAAMERGQLDQARGIYDRLVKLQPENGLWIERRGQLQPGLLAVWNFDIGTGRWGSAHNCDLSVKDGVLTALTTGDDPYFMTPASGPAGGKAIVLRYRADEAFTMQIFWADSPGGFDDSRHLDYPIPASSGEWAEITLPFWCLGTLNHLRLDPNTAREHPLEIDSIVLQHLESIEAGSSEAWMRIIQQQPNLTQAAFEAFQKAERWNEAADFALQLIQRNPKDTLTWLKAAPVLALADDPAIYTDFCERMVAQFADSNDAAVVERTIKACLLRVNSIELSKLPAEKLAKIMDEGTTSDDFKQWGWGTHACWAYRIGDAESAVNYVAKSEELKPWDDLHAMNLAVLAMARHQLKRPDEARQALDEASQLINRLKSDENNKANHNVLIAQILFREAETLINGKPKS